MAEHRKDRTETGRSQTNGHKRPKQRSVNDQIKKNRADQKAKQVGSENRGHQEPGEIARAGDLVADAIAG
jgi:hypothetical protein